MKGKFLKKAIAAALVLLMVSGTVQLSSFTGLLSDMSITAKADGTDNDPVTGNNDSAETIEGYEFKTDAQGNYLILSADDWNNLAEVVKAGNNCSGKTFKLMNDITVTQPVGCQISSSENDRMRFAGTFDGSGRTLTVSLNANNLKNNKNYCAPFSYADSVTIKNLTVLGTIRVVGSQKFAAGLVGSMTGDNKIENVHVGVVIDSTVNGDGTDGGVVGILETDNTLDFDNCWFDGKLLGKYTYSCGGFVGYNKGKINFRNCLFNPSELTFNTDYSGDGSATFARLQNSSRQNNRAL